MGNLGLTGRRRNVLPPPTPRDSWFSRAKAVAGGAACLLTAGLASTNPCRHSRGQEHVLAAPTLLSLMGVMRVMAPVLAAARGASLRLGWLVPRPSVARLRLATRSQVPCSMRCGAGCPRCGSGTILATLGPRSARGIGCQKGAAFPALRRVTSVTARYATCGLKPAAERAAERPGGWARCATVKGNLPRQAQGACRYQLGSK